MMTRAYQQRPPKRKRPRTALGDVMAGLRRGASVTTLLEEAIGSELAEVALKTFTRVEIATIRAPQSAYEETRNGGMHAPARSARASFAAAPMRGADESCTRHQALVFLAILEGFWHDPHDPAHPRACGSKLYVPRLAARAGVTVREVQRYLAAFRTAGLLTTWQPPVTERTPKVMRGKRHAYNVYRLERPLPRVLRERLMRFQGAAKDYERAKARALSVDLGTDASAPAPATLGDAGARFLERHPHLRPPGL